MAKPRNVDVELGELAIAMETRAHGHVSMEPVTRPNNRGPLDRRSFTERLGNTSPTDPALPFDANADAERVCVTANNGLCGVSHHSVVPQRMEEELQAQLAKALNTDRDLACLSARLLGRPPAPNRLYTEAESPLINRWTRAIARSMDASGSAVAVEPKGWQLAASDGTAEMGETCLAICLWPPNAPGPGAGSPIVLVIRPGPHMDVRVDRHPGLSGQPLPADLDDYVERVLVAAAGVYWAKRGVAT